jgi:hypothetical protein
MEGLRFCRPENGPAVLLHGHCHQGHGLMLARAGCSRIPDRRSSISDGMLRDGGILDMPGHYDALGKR